MLLRSSIFHWLFSVNSLNSDCLQISPSLAAGDQTASLEMTPGYACWIVPATLHFRERMHIKVYFQLENASLFHWAVLDSPLKQNSQWCIWLQVGLWGYFCPAMQYCQECLHLNKKSFAKGRTPTNSSVCYADVGLILTQVPSCLQDPVNLDYPIILVLDLETKQENFLSVWQPL